MTFLAPWALAVGAVAAASIVALHFLARARPRRMLLPTARFIPERSAHARALTKRPADLALLALRVLAVLLLGAAFARPVVAPHRRAVARVVAVDRSRAVGDVGAARDRAAEFLRPGDVLVVFDSIARPIAADPADTLAALTRSRARGSVSAALVASLRAAATLRSQANVVELVLVSPVATEEWDVATDRLAAPWTGRVRLIRVPPVAPSDARPNAIRMDSVRDDPLRATISLLGARAVGDVRVARGTAVDADTAWAMRAGRVLVRWPDLAIDHSPNVPHRADSAGAVMSEHAVVVAPFARGEGPPVGQPVAWWGDGRPAATERPMGAGGEGGCVRDVAIDVPRRGDLVLSANFERLVADLIAPCGGAPSFGRVPDSLLLWIDGRADGTAPASRGGLTQAAVAGQRGMLASWLLAAAALLLLVEPLARRRAAEPDA
ncbi:MAG TPA: BatA domain-containing protein [Gemmatimonadaceae bacterium]